MKSNLNILHIGWGFYPWRRGGLILYARDLMAEQVRNGHHVSYFCAGRKLPVFKKPFLYKWSNDGIRMFEIINSPIVHRGDAGPLEPGLTLSEKVSEAFFEQVLQTIKPDIIHIHELAGLPSSLIDIMVDRFNIPCLMTLADYYLLCPCLKLFNHAEKKNCRLTFHLGKVCQECIKAAPEHLRNDELETIRMVLNYLESKFHLYESRAWYRFLGLGFDGYTWIRRLHRERLPGNKQKLNSELVSNQKISDQLELRRRINIQRMKKISALVARSSKVKQIYNSYLTSKNSIRVVNPYLHHIDKIFPKQTTRAAIQEKVKFVTLNGFVSEQKGAIVLSDAIKVLNKKGYQGQFQVHAFGGMRDVFKKNTVPMPNFFYHGPYEGVQLNRLLEDMHVGIVPSIWEEVFGYVGLELLAKGLPVIANNKGGITDYVFDDKNGYLNKNISAESLAESMERYITNKGNILKHNQNILNDRHRNYSVHYSKIMSVYQDTVSRDKYARQK